MDRHGRHFRLGRMAEQGVPGARNAILNSLKFGCPVKSALDTQVSPHSKSPSWPFFSLCRSPSEGSHVGDLGEKKLFTKSLPYLYL